MGETENINRNASASAFGWEFQANAAIVLFIRNIDNADAVRVEGLEEDIEIYLNNGDKIYGQAKANTTTEPGKNSTTRFYEALTTLKESVKRDGCKQIVYVTNDDYPLGKRNDFTPFHEDCFLRFKELPPALQDFTRTHATELGMQDESLDKLSIMVLGFTGEDPNTRHKIIRRWVKDLLDGLSLSGYPGINDGNLRNQWGLLFHENASSSNPHICITKEDFVWPIIVMLCDNGRRDYSIDDFDPSFVEEVIEQYDSTINYQSQKFELVTKIIAAFERFVATSGASHKSAMRSSFVNSVWLDYLEDFGLDVLHDSDEREVMAKAVLISILRRESVIKSIKKGVNLED